jgi:hypothetical protein
MSFPGSDGVIKEELSAATFEFNGQVRGGDRIGNGLLLSTIGGREGTSNKDKLSVGPNLVDRCKTFLKWILLSLL